MNTRSINLLSPLSFISFISAIPRCGKSVVKFEEGESEDKIMRESRFFIPLESSL